MPTPTEKMKGIAEKSSRQPERSPDSRTRQVKTLQLPFSGDLPIQPGLGKGPVALRRPRRQAGDLRHTGQRQPGETVQLHYVRDGGIGLGQFREGLIQSEQVIQHNADLHRQIRLFEVVRAGLKPAPTISGTPLAKGLLSSGALDEDAAHGLGGGREEMLAAVPALWLMSDEPEIGFVNQSRGLQRLSGLFVGQLLCGQETQLLVDQGQKLSRGIGIPLLDGVQYAGNVTRSRSAPIMIYDL